MFYGWPIQYALMARSCNTWRNFDDIQCNANQSFSCWQSVSKIIGYWGGAGHTHNDFEAFVNVAAPGAFNDADQLVIGNADHPYGGNSSSEQCLRQPGNGLSCGKLSLAEEQTQMALWSIFASPLLMSNDPRLG
jgi:hypothetical protein